MSTFAAAWGGFLFGATIMLLLVLAGRWMDRRENDRMRRRVLHTTADDNQLAVHGDPTQLPHDWPGKAKRRAF